MKRYIRADRRRGYKFDYAGAGYVRKTLTLHPYRSFDYDYSRGGEAYVLYFSSDDGEKYAYYCQNGNSPIFDNYETMETMKISCQVKEPLEYPASSNTDKYDEMFNWILRPRLLK